MSTRRRSDVGPAHTFGGEWTETKLSILKHYLTAYTTALKNTCFRLGYVDAFAGTGYRSLREESQTTPLLPDLAADEPQALLDGSVRIALSTEPRFDWFVFIERDPVRCAELEGLKEQHPDIAQAVSVRQGDANAEIQRMCALDWRGRRAVLFLDPYGMQVDWTTIEAVASTQAIDMWLLFPLGIGLNRLVTRTGSLPKGWADRLDRFLGTQDWREEFYREERTLTLFGEQTTRVKAGVDAIGRYFIRRLESAFQSGGVALPRVLLNSARCPLYVLCFASGNPRGAKVALNIAGHLLKMGS
ncbi:three-Cys-motif partner protein TcmP [Myxococcota bacterium]|nr:three-Cys-motif partner protein TcmP [Myxococcota bacterium]